MRPCARLWVRCGAPVAPGPYTLQVQLRRREARGFKVGREVMRIGNARRYTVGNLEPYRPPIPSTGAHEGVVRGRGNKKHSVSPW